MSGSVAERRDRLAMAVAERLELVGRTDEEATALKRAIAEAVTQGLLDVLEPPVADMVRRGVCIVVAGDGKPAYRPALPDAEPSPGTVDELERWKDEGGSVPPASDVGPEVPSSSPRRGEGRSSSAGEGVARALSVLQRLSHSGRKRQASDNLTPWPSHPRSSSPRRRVTWNKGDRLGPLKEAEAVEAD